MGIRVLKGGMLTTVQDLGRTGYQSQGFSVSGVMDIRSFKIEGRMKSAYYTAVVTNAYRMAMDAAEQGRPYDPRWLRELESVSHREYDTGYFFTSPHENAETCVTQGYLREKAYLATVLSYDETTGEALCVQRNKVTVGVYRCSVRKSSKKKPTTATGTEARQTFPHVL